MASARGTLGKVLRRLGDLEGARAEHGQALAIYEAQYGPNGPEVGASRANLGLVLRGLGDLEGARTELEEAVAILAANDPDDSRIRDVRSLLEDLHH